MTEPDERTFPDLVGDMLRAVLGVVRSTARMFGFELREATHRIGRHIALLIVSSVLATTGLLLLLGALALFAEYFFHVPLWAALAVIGLLAAALGAFGLRTALRRLASANFTFPGTVAELGKDVEALTRPTEPR